MKLIALASAILLAFSTIRAESDRKGCKFVDPAGNTIKMLDYETHVIRLEDTPSLELTGYVHFICRYGKLAVFQSNAAIATSKFTSIVEQTTIATNATQLSETQKINIANDLKKYFDTRSLVSINDDQKTLGFLRAAMTSLAKSDAIPDLTVKGIIRSYYNAYSTGLARYTLPVDDTGAPNAAIDALLQFIAVVSVKNTGFNFDAEDNDVTFTDSAVNAEIAVKSTKTENNIAYNVNLQNGNATLHYAPNTPVLATSNVQSILVKVNTPKYEKNLDVGNIQHRFISDIFFTGNYTVTNSIATRLAQPIQMELKINFGVYSNNDVKSVYFNNTTKKWTEISHTASGNLATIILSSNDAIAYALVSTTNNTNDEYDTPYFMSTYSTTFDTLNACLKHASSPNFCWKCDSKSTTPLVQNIMPINYSNTEAELTVGKCVDVCPEGLYNDNSTCLRCPFGATKCDSFTKSTACIADFSLSNGKCIPSSKVKFSLTKRFVRANKDVNASYGQFTNPDASQNGFTPVPILAILGETFKVTCASYYTSGEETLTFKYDTHKGFYWESDQKCVFDKNKVSAMVDSIKNKTLYSDIETILDSNGFDVLMDAEHILPSKDSSSLSAVYNAVAQVAYAKNNFMEDSYILTLLIYVARNFNSANTDQVPSADIENLVLNIFKVANSRLTTNASVQHEDITKYDETIVLGTVRKQAVVANAALPEAVTTTLKSAVTSANYFNLTYTNEQDPLALIPINIFTDAQVMQMGALEIYAANTFLPISNLYAYGAAVGVQLFDKDGRFDSQFLAPTAELIWGSRVGPQEFNLVAGLDYSSPTCYGAFEKGWVKLGAPEIFVSSKLETVYLCKADYKYDLVAAVGKSPNSFADILAIKGVFGKAIFAMTAVVLLSSLIL